MKYERAKNISVGEGRREEREEMEREERARD